MSKHDTIGEHGRELLEEVVFRLRLARYATMGKEEKNNLDRGEPAGDSRMSVSGLGTGTAWDGVEGTCELGGAGWDQMTSVPYMLRKGVWT